jgi:hypothetical protein
MKLKAQIRKKQQKVHSMVILQDSLNKSLTKGLQFSKRV